MIIKKLINKRCTKLKKINVFLPHIKNPEKTEAKYDSEKLTPVIRCSICTGEKVAGFRDKATGKFTDVMLLKSSRDLEAFRRKYGIEGDIENIY